MSINSPDDAPVSAPLQPLFSAELREQWDPRRQATANADETR